MVEQNIVDIAADFKRYWTEVFGFSERFRLDFSWPSVAIVDRLLFPLRFKKEFSSSDLRAIKGAAAYLAGMAHDCWHCFPDKLEIRLDYRTEPSAEIVLRARGGRYLDEEESYSISLIRALTSILGSGERELRPFANATFPIYRETNILSLFASGLFTGLSMYGGGKWKELDITTAYPYIGAAESYLCQTSAAYYNSVFPYGEHANLPEFYAAGLILPPPGYKEEFLAARSIETVFRHYREAQATEDSILATSLELATSFDDAIANVGFVVAAAFQEEKIPPELFAFGAARAAGVAGLRPAFLYARSLLGRVESFTDLLKNKQFEEAQKRAMIEHDLGLLPMLLPQTFAFLSQAALGPMFYFAAWSDPGKALGILEFHSKHERLPVMLQLQHLWLLILKGDYDAALSRMNTYSLDPESLQSGEERFAYFVLKGEIAEGQGAIAEARGFFARACDIGSKFARVYTGIARRLVSLHLLFGDIEKASLISDKLQQHHSKAFDAKLVNILIEVARQSEVTHAEIQELFSMAGNAPFVFSLCKDLLIEGHG